MLAQAGLSEDELPKASRASLPPVAYLELHIEQGERLEQAHRQIGIPNAIVGLHSYRIEFFGQAAHAGTTPMESRQDAALGASAFTLQIRERVLERYREAVCNTGNVHLHPGAFNIIPGHAELSFEFRAPKAKQLSQLEKETRSLTKRIADAYGLQVRITALGRHPPAEMNETLQKSIQEVASAMRLTTLRMPSYAGHDAQALTAICPSAMIFIPSVQGISHSPQEYSRWEDCLNGANVLLRTTLRTASQMQ